MDVTPPRDAVAVDVRGLEHRFGPTRVLRALDLVVLRGEHVAITGPNGSGKTTLLRVLAGLLRPTGGVVRVLGGLLPDAGVRRRLGVVMHRPGLYDRMTAQENLTLWADVYGDARAARRGRDLAAALGLDPGDRRPVASYSYGMRRRLAIARALSTAPELVLADEPFAGLDDEGVRAIEDLLSCVETVILATHDIDRVATGRRLHLRGGRLES